MEKLNVKTLSLIAIMAALSNVLSFFRIVIPGPVPIIFQVVQFPYFLLAVGLGPLEGAITGAIGSLLMAYTIWSYGGAGPFIPIGNAILAGVTGIVAKKLRIMERKPSFWPVLCAIIGEIGLRGGRKGRRAEQARKHSQRRGAAPVRPKLAGSHLHT